MRKKQTPQSSKISTANKNKILAHASLGGNNSDYTNYVKSHDLPLEFSKTRLENNQEKFVPFLDYDNNFLDLFYEVYSTSPTNRCILEQKISMVCGDGFYPTAKRRLFLPPNELTDDQIEQLDTLLSDVNKSENIYDIFKKVATDFVIYGNAYVEMIRGERGGVAYFKQYHIPFAWGRIAKTEGVTPERIGISQKWIEDDLQPDDLKELPLYPNWEQTENGGERTVIHIKDYNTRFLYYGLPDWVAAVVWGELEYRIAKYNQSKFKNGFFPSSLIQFFGAATQEEASKLLERFKSKMTDTENNSMIFAQVLADESYKADVQILEDKNEGNFLNLSNICRQNIVTAQRWTMSLAGMGISGQLGSNQQIRTEFEVLQNTVIKPIQNTLLGEWVNKSIKEARGQS
jgi:hypothetical protein